MVAVHRAMAVWTALLQRFNQGSSGLLAAVVILWYRFMPFVLMVRYSTYMLWMGLYRLILYTLGKIGMDAFVGFSVVLCCCFLRWICKILLGDYGGYRITL